MNDNPIQNIKFLLLDQSLEMNEYKKEHNSVPFEVYEYLLETALWLTDSYIDEVDRHDKFVNEIGNMLGVTTNK